MVPHPISQKPSLPSLWKSALAASSSMYKSAKILLVEDSALNRTIIANMINKLGFQADTAENGQQALACLEHHTYDLILMDCEMPILDGYATTQEIRRREQLQGKPPIPVVALTAHVTSKHLDQTVGMTDYLTKPLHLKQLNTILQRWLTSPPQENQSLDPQVLEHLGEVLGTPAKLRLIQQFLEYAPQQLSALQQLLANRETEALFRKAHQFRGESLQIGAQQLGNLCKELENLAQSNQLAMASICLTKLTQELTRVSHILSQVNHHDD